MYENTTTELILKLLLYKTCRYKDVEKMIRKYKGYENTSDRYIRNVLSRLKKKKLVTHNNSIWSAGKLAHEVIESKRKFNKKYIGDKKVKMGSKNIIVMYDIPEKLRGKRNRLRESLETLEFRQIQKSVWIGYSPLPKGFIEYLNELKIIEYVNFFQVKEKDII